MEDIKIMLGVLLRKVNNIEAHVKHLKRTAQDLQQSSSKRTRNTMVCMCGGVFTNETQPARGRCFYCGIVFCDLCMLNCYVCGLLMHEHCLELIEMDGGRERVCRECIIHCTECGQTFTVIDEEVSLCSCCGYHQCRECLDTHKARRIMLYFALVLELPNPILHALRPAFDAAYTKERQEEDLREELANSDEDDE